MQITNNYQPNFKSLKYSSLVKDEVKEILKKRVKPKDLEAFIDRLEKSPVKATLGLADGSGFDRLDVELYYKSPYIINPRHREIYTYIAEKRRFNFFNFRPKHFMDRVLSELNTIEETYGIGKYSK